MKGREIVEGPILFSTPMVQATIDDRKTKTRRVVKPHRKATIENMWIDKDDGQVVVVYNDNYHIGEKGYIKCPYGKVGDILWVRETWQQLPSGFDEIPPEDLFIYKASNELSSECARWRPAIHMPRKACRIKLKIIDIGIERIQDISEEGAMSEGIRAYSKDRELYKYCVNIDLWLQQGNTWKNMPRTAKEAFRILWDSINKSRGYGWDMNPWVWVISFERIDKQCQSN